MSTATMDAPPTPMQVEVDVSIGKSKAEEASADKRKLCRICAAVLVYSLVCSNYFPSQNEASYLLYSHASADIYL